MNTGDLVDLLANHVDAVDRHAVAKRIGVAAGGGVLGAALLMAILLGVRDDLGAAVRLPMFWVKLGYVGCVAAAGVWSMSRLGRPGARDTWLLPALAAPVVVIWLLGGMELAASDAVRRNDLLFGRTWHSCPFLIALLSLPAFAAAVWALRGLAPTRLRLAGGIAGFASGAIAAVVYSLHCPEMGAPFLGVWYLAGMLIPAAVGALLAPRLLRW